MAGRAAKPPAAIAVVGMACWYPGARSPAELWENILARRQEFRRFLEQRMPAGEYHSDDPDAVDRTYGTLGCFLDGFQFDLNAWRIPRPTFASADISHWLALDVASRALADAGHPNGDGLSRARVAVIVGNSLTGEQTRANSLRLRWPFVRRIVQAELEHLPAAQADALLEAIGERYRAHFPATTEDTLAGSLSNTIAGRICGAFDFGGGGYVVDGACSSSLLAVCTAASALEEGRVDACVAGGVDISLDPFELVGFAKARALTPTDMRVYDRRGNGFVPGEGCGFVLLERLEDARAAGKRVYAVLEGWGIASDGRNPITAPKVEGQARAIRTAWARSGRPDFVEGHGTGTTVGDRVELEAIALAAGDGAGPRSIGVTSLKSILGHTKAAAGIGAFLKAVIAVNRRVVPPTAGCVEPNAVFEGPARALYPVRRGQLLDADAIVRAGASAMGFGGINTHVVVASADPADARLAPALPERALLASAQDSEIFVLGASTLEQLRRQAIELAAVAEGVACSELADLSAHLAAHLAAHVAASQAPEPAVRAALVAASPRELVRLLDRLASLEQSAGPEIWLGRASVRPRIGFLCPGQGSQELHAAAVLMARDPELDALARRLADVAAREGCPGLLDALYPSSDPAVAHDELADWRERLRATQMAQPAICLVSLLWAARLRQLGIVPSVVAGHSLGELTAFALAGAIDDETLMRLAVVRGRAMASPSDRAGGMLSLEATVADVGSLCSGIAGYLEIANVNAERQVVVAGELAALDVLFERARARSIQARRLAVSNGFHSELVADAARRLRDEAPVPERMREPSVTLLSSLVPAPIHADALDLREHIARHVRSPLDFVGLLDRVAAHCDVLVEVGSGRVLSGLARDCRPVEGKPGKASDLHAVLADAWVRGVAIRWDMLHVGRLVRPFVAPHERIFIGNPCETGPSHASRSIASTPRPVAQAVALAPASTVAPAPASTAAPLHETLLAQMMRDVADKTGFDAATLSGEQRLQDDLNLDSIKAGEIVAAAARRAAVVDRVDPSLYLREPIDAIARALAELAAESKRAPTAETPIVEATHEPVTGARWVRTFGLSVEPAAPARASDWSGASVRVLADPAVAEQLRRAGASIDPTGRDVVAMLEPASTHEQVAQLRRIVDALDGDVRSLLLVQRLDGRFGTHDPGQGPAVAAFGRSIALERPQLAVLLLDVAPSIPLVLERPATPGFTAIGIDAEGRWSLVARPLRSADYRPRRRLEPGELVLATGGARGITAACVEALARTTGVRLALVGSTPRDRVDDEIVRTLGRLALAGIEARYWPCDLADASAVAATVREVVASQGPIAAVVHGAGRNTPRRVEKVSAAEALAEITPKLLGAEALFDALADAPPRLFVALTSIIGVSGMPGNAWYAYANESLDLAVARFCERHPSCTAISLAFGVWSEVGMGVKLGSVAALARMGIGALDPSEGVARFVELVTRDPGVRQPIVTAHVDGLPTWPASWPSDPTLAFTDGALAGVPGVEAKLRVTLHPDRHVWLRDHDFRGSLLLPTVFGLEAMAQVAWLASGGGDAVVAEVRDVELPAPIVVAPAGTTIELRACVREAEPGVVDCEIRTEQTDFARPHFAAVVVFEPQLELARLERLPELAPADPPIDPARDLYGGLLFQGPAFARIESIRGGGRLADGTPALRFSGLAGEGRWLLGDPFLRDAILQAGQLLVAQDESLPVRIARWGVAAGHDVGGRREVLSTILQSTPRRHVGAAVVVDEEGRRLAWLEGYEVSVLAHRPERADLDEILRPGLQRRAALAKLLERRKLPAHVILEELALHGLAQPERREIVRRWLPEVAWSETGEPVLGDARSLSVAHDDGACLLVIADVRVGCDIEPIRARADWDALLGPERARLLPALRTGGDDRETAGTRVWAAAEALFKAGGGRGTPTPSVREGEVVELELPGWRIVTFPFPLARGPVRMVAIAIAVAVADVQTRVAPRIEPDLLRVALRSGAPDRMETRFVVSFDESGSLAGQVPALSLVTWMGRLRELALAGLQAPMLEALASGRSGMVTQNAEVRLTGEATALDRIEALTWVEDLRPSTCLLRFAFAKLTADGRRESVGEASQRFGWVDVLGHGQVRAARFPAFLYAFLEALHHDVPVAPTRPLLLPGTPALARASFNTSLVDGNVVGNLYYARYFAWAQRTIEREVFQPAPEQLAARGRLGELVTTAMRIEFIHEAMPFDTIDVSLHPAAAAGPDEVAFDLVFARPEPDGGHTRLAIGRIEGRWSRPAEPDRQRTEASAWASAREENLT